VSRPPLVVDVSDLLRQPGTRRPWSRSVELEGVATTAAWVPPGEPVAVDLALESITGASVVAEGSVAVTWEATCRRCLEPVGGRAEAEVREVFEPHPTEGETYAIDQGVIDLGAMVRDSAMLALPLAPLCRPDCEGPAPGGYPVRRDPGDEERPRDPRWAALDELRTREN
jgi:uncharacterized protein